MLTYNEFIQNIINTRGQWNISDNEYFEVHHVIPKCMGGGPKRIPKNKKHENLIWLTAQEHYEAHKLLAKENPDNWYLQHAWWNFCTRKASPNTPKIFIAADDYAEAKIKHSQAQKELMSGDKNPMKNKEVSQRVAEKLKCIERTPEWNLKNSLSHIGLLTGSRNGNYNSGTNHWTNNSAEKYRTSMASKSEEEIKLINKKRSDTFNSRPLEEQLEINKRKTAKLKECRKKPVKCLETGEIFDSIGAASNFYNIRAGAINNQIKGLIDTAGGYHWEYINKEVLVNE